jgi:hypothetical protein
MSFLKGALIEYGTDFMGPIPNIVLFQFNPDTMSRSIQIPERPSGRKARETTQAGEIPTETISLKAEFSAAEQLNSGNILARTLGIGPQLAALEKMVYPSENGGLLGAALDAIGDALGLGGSDDSPTQPIPRKQYPRILFIWGATRVLPVTITSMSITEQQYDTFLNPIRAEVSLGLRIINQVDKLSNDVIGKGAFEYSKTAKDVQAALNLAGSIQVSFELVLF